MGDLPIRYGKIKNKEAGAVLRSRPCPHRFDESPTDYSWASCSPAELACALSAGAFCYTGTPFVNPLSANGQPCLISVSHIRGKVHSRLSTVHTWKNGQARMPVLRAISTVRPTTSS